MSQKFKFTKDNDGHWYIIDADQQDQFNQWVEDMENDRDTDVDFEEFAADDPECYAMLMYPIEL